MRIEIWFDNDNREAMMRCFPNVDEKSINADGDWLRFASATSDHTFNINKSHILFVEFMPTEN